MADRPAGASSPGPPAPGGALSTAALGAVVTAVLLATVVYGILRLY